MSWDAKYAILLAASTLITWISGILLEKYDKTNWRKAVVVISCILNLGMLCYFKYFNFFLNNINTLLEKAGFDSIAEINIVLPVGISFYIFQALSYTIDVYRQEVKAERNLFRYALFVSFFPQLVAGPIERSKNLLNQIRVPTIFSYEKMRQGLILMVYGFFMKVVMADNIAIVVNTVFENVELYPGWYLIIAGILFAFQIYGDFGGYSLIAIGSAKVLGFELMENFNSPYFAQSVSEFWRRWHISLSTWFRDYLYIPLGGNRKGKVKKTINTMVVFLTSGLWHGASWNFVYWGGLNGAFQVIEGLTLKIKNIVNRKLGVKKESLGYKMLKGVITFVLVDFAWLFFRANSLEHAIQIIKSIISEQNIWILFDGSLYLLGLEEKQFRMMIFSIVIVMLLDYLKYKGIDLVKGLEKQQLWFRWSIYIVSILAILVFGAWGGNFNETTFIYFQF